MDERTASAHQLQLRGYLTMGAILGHTGASKAQCASDSALMLTLCALQMLVLLLLLLLMRVDCGKLL